MTNALTGDYEAVVEVSVSAVNRVLATLHERGPAAKAAAAPAAKEIRLPHAFSVRVGGLPPKLPKTPPGEPATPVESPVLQPPGGTAFAPTLHGMAQVQLSTPTLALATGTARDVGVSCDVLVRYLPDADSAAIPTYLRGRVDLTLPVELAPLGKATTLNVDPGRSDVEVRFTPSAATPLSSAERELVAGGIRQILRYAFQPGTIALPNSLRLGGIKKLGGLGTETIALPVGLEDTPVSAAGLDTIGAIFIKPGDDFGVALARERIQAMLEPARKTIREVSFPYSVSVEIFGVSAKLVSYTVSVKSADLDWDREPGALVLIAKGEATGPGIWPDYDFEIRQRLVLRLHPKTNAVLIVADELTIEGSLPAAGKDAAVPAVIAERDKALITAQTKLDLLSSKLDLNMLVGALGSPSPATARWTAASFDPAGVVLRGALAIAERAPAHVAFGPLPADQGYTAFESWVPGGRITRYTWWYSTPLFSAGDKKSFVVEMENHDTVAEDRFVYLEEIPREAAQLCLIVSGTQLPSKGGPEVAVGGGAIADVGGPGGTLCAVHHANPFLPPLTIKPGSGKLPITVIDWGPGPGPDPAPWIVAHLNAAPRGRPEDGSVNAVVHFSGDSAVDEIETLVAAIGASARVDSPISLIVVLPAGFLQRDANALSDALAQAPVDGSVSLAIAEDYERTWQQTFEAEGAPETHVLDARGQRAWRANGPVDKDALTAALDQSLIQCARGGSRLARLAVEAGDSAPDFVFAYARERRIPLRHLQGRPIELLFWKAWSTPCLQELTHASERRRSRAGPLLLAIHDGEDTSRAAAVLQDAPADLLMVPDPAGTISRRYDVNCWPSTVGIDPLGIVRSLQLGLSPHAREWHTRRPAC